jgi:hypothetical protein
MKKIMTKIGLGAALLLLVGAAVQPVQAACTFPGILSTTLDAATDASQIMTDSFYANSNPSPYGYPGSFYSYTGPPIDTGSLTAVWWALGTGDPAIGAGDDNGSWDASRWITFYSGQGPGGTFYYGATFATGWSAGEVDGCIANNATGCNCMLLTQQAPGDVARFALLSQAATPAGDAFFVLPGNAPILMVPIPSPQIVSSTRDANLDLTVTASLPSPGAGVYQLGGCDCNLSYRIREIVQTRGLSPPTSRDAADWGGVQNPVDAADTTSSIFSACGATNTDVYLATELVPDPASGFTSPLVSELATRIECGPTLADPTPDKDRVPKAKPYRGGRTGR